MRTKTIVFLIFIDVIPILFAASTLQHKEIAIGFNAPVTEKPSLAIIENKETLHQHWISEKLGVQNLQKISNDVDFSAQFIVVIQIGARNTATGNMNIAEIEFNEENENVVVYVRVGVNDRDCEKPKLRSYPYVVGAINKPVNWPITVNYYIGNFGDGCKQTLGVES